LAPRYSHRLWRKWFGSGRGFIGTVVVVVTGAVVVAIVVTTAASVKVSVRAAGAVAPGGTVTFRARSSAAP
jgi:hypothetical protein